MKYKLIVLDLDGTLTNSKKEITPRNRETLIRMQEQGIRLVLASGRLQYLKITKLFKLLVFNTIFTLCRSEC